MTTDTSAQTVTDYLMNDHRRLDGLMETCRDLVEAADMKGAAATYAEFRQGLMRHIKIEEGLLFPEFEAATGLARNSGPTGVMRFEHAEIIRLLDLIKELFDGAAPAATEFDSLRSALVALLHEHNGKEERILYPMTDRMVAPALLRDLVSKMKAFE
jgi:iron-sulfur cluster repair protein YtfE (RIC family)